MKCVIGYVIILCAGAIARCARLKYKNGGLTMMLFTNSYENHNRVYLRLSLASVEVSKRYSNHIRRCRANKITRLILIGWQAYRGDQLHRKIALYNPEIKSK